MMYPQFALELSLSDEPRLENLIVGRNVEVLRHLYDLIAGTVFSRWLCICGALAVRVKTHILRSLAVMDRAVYLTACDFDDEVALSDFRWFLVDDVDGFSARQQTHFVSSVQRDSLRSESAIPMMSGIWC